MFARPATPLRALPLYAIAVLAFVVTFVFRYNAPEGSFGGLTDDHFFYVTQGWQMLFGELPDRDYFEPGAPLMLVISAALQTLTGRSVWSEYWFCTGAIALGSSVTFVLAARASGSILLGLLAFLFQFSLLPRLYGYPKILVYAVAIAVIWAWLSSPVPRRALVVALVTALAFLLRHDHGAYVGFAFLVALIAITGLAFKERVKQAVLYGVTVLALLSPYLIYLQLNGGIERHFVTTYAWSARDFTRAPRVLPTLEWRPLFQDVDSDAPAQEWWEHAPFAVLSEYSTFWLFWLFVVLPPVALLLLVTSPATGPPVWAQERAKVLVTSAVGVAVVYGFLRGNLAGRLADVVMPMSVLGAWSLARVWTVVRAGRVELAGRQRPVGTSVRAAVGVIGAIVVVVTVLVLTRPFRGAIENAKVLEGVESMRSQMGLITERLQHTWPLDLWAPATRSDFALARYIQACTAPGDRVLVTEFRPQILGLAQRGFAGGHVELRGGGFFATPREQELTVQRWRRQHVPIVIGPTAEQYPDWAESLPLVARYLTTEYRSLGEKNVDGFEFLLFERRDEQAARVYEPLAFPCFR
ncbi:MAG: hypothetical protein ABL986_22155 [Vicinamibacterales bacterium]